MRYLTPLVGRLLMTGFTLAQDTNMNFIKYVNPMIGTARMEHTYSGATAPFGMVQLSPDTDTVCSKWQIYRGRMQILRWLSISLCMTTSMCPSPIYDLVDSRLT